MLELLLLQVVALEGATVHTMEDGAVPAPAVVLIEDGEITAVGPDVVVPEGATRVDLSGRHLVPGLIDGMANHDAQHDPLHTASGVLLVRDAGNDLDLVTTARAATEQQAAVGPDLFVCGLVFDGQPPATTNSVIVRTAEEAAAKLESLLEWDLDYVGTHQGIPLEAWRAVITGAHAAGLEAWGPAPRGATLADVAASGLDGLFFLDAFAPADGGTTLTDEEIAAYVEAVSNAGLELTPMLRAYTRYLGEGDESALGLLSPTYEMQWRSELASRERYAQDEAWRADTRARIDSQRRLVAALHAAGVPLVPGSGAPHPWLVPGAGLHDELAEWKAAGIADADLLRAATIDAARALGVAERYGRIAVGARANLVAVDGDPTEDVGRLRYPSGVCLRGRWHEGTQLAEWLQSVREYQLDARDALDQPIVIDRPDLPEGAAPLLAGTAETRVFGLRTAVERYIVARVEDDYVYAMRRRAPRGLGMPDAETHLTQTISGDQLSRFELTVTSGGTIYRVEGVRIGGQFRLERRVDGAQVDTTSTTRRPMFVDVGSVLPSMILAKHRGAGPVSVLYFEGMDPAVAEWNAQLRENGLFVVGTPTGGMVAGVAKDGSLQKAQRQRGNDVERVETVERKTYGGPGLSLPDERVFRAEGEAAEASAPADPASEGPDPAPKGPRVR